METFYTCPMHPEIKINSPGNCPKCHMNLVQNDRLQEDKTSQSKLSTYQPLVIIISLIAIATAAFAIKEYQNNIFSWQNTFANFMAGFFLVFAGFKLLDIKGFAKGYASYDLLARRFSGYGYLYPFLELTLGLAYLTRFALPTTNIVTFFLMGFSGLGVLISLAQKRKFQCACLGTIIKVPLTNVTLVEDFGMATMALIMVLSIA